MRTTLLSQIRQRRKTLNIRSSDMLLLAGINRQQYEKIEKGGNPSLITLDKICEGLDAELMLIPKEKVGEIRRILAAPSLAPSFPLQNASPPERSYWSSEDEETIQDPWVLIEGEKRK